MLAVILSGTEGDGDTILYYALVDPLSFASPLASAVPK